MDESLIQRAAALIRAAARITVFTGAGVSKESGIPTFRDAQEGLWARYDPQALATPQGFAANPKLVWDWYEYRRGLLRQAQPNPGHAAVVQLAARKPVRVITQNIDDLHEQAGSVDVLHLHGAIARTKCFNACRGEPTLLEPADLLPGTDTEPPRCPHCGGFARPDVVWFNEMLSPDVLQAAGEALATCDLMIVAGTSGVVYPAARFPGIAKQNGAALIEVNPEESLITPIVDVWLQAPSGVALPQVLAAL